MVKYLIQYANTEVEAKSFGEAAKKALKEKPIVAAVHLLIDEEPTTESDS